MHYTCYVFLLTDIVFFADAGGAIVLGKGKGYREGLGMRSPPEAETYLDVRNLVAVNNQVFGCWEGICYMYDTEQNHRQWRKLQPGPIYWNEGVSVAVGSHIWFFGSVTLYDFDTATGLTERFYLPFSVRSSDCAVANAAHIYVVQSSFLTGYSFIWVNFFASYPFLWIIVAVLPIEVSASYCLMFKDQIYIAGGGSHRRQSSLAFVVDVNTYTVQQVANLTIPRFYGQTMVLDCKPAVVGGRGKNASLSNIEVYDNTINEWTVHGLSLQARKSDFGLVQFIP